MKENYLEYTLNLDPKSEWNIVMQNDVMDALDLCIQEIGNFWINGTSRTERQGLESYQIFMNISGTSTLIYRDKEYFIEPSDAGFIDCREHYIMKNEADTRSIFVHFVGEKVKVYFDYFLSANAASPVIKLQNRTGMERELQKLLDLFREQVTPEVCFRGVECIFHMMTQFIKEAGKAASGSDSDVRIAEILDYISMHYAEKIMLDDIAKKACLSKYYLEKLFYRSQGCTPMEYLSRVRIAHAKEMLRMTNLSVGEIGNRVGVEDASYFVRMFRKYEDMTPNKYRMLWKTMKTNE